MGRTYKLANAPEQMTRPLNSNSLQYPTSPLACQQGTKEHVSRGQLLLFFVVVFYLWPVSFDKQTCFIVKHVCYYLCLYNFVVG